MWSNAAWMISRPRICVFDWYWCFIFWLFLVFMFGESVFGRIKIELTKSDPSGFALLFDDTVLRFVELDRQSEVTVDGFERLDFRGVLDGFGFQGVAGFDTEVPIVLDIARGDIDQGVLVVDGLNFSSIRITDSDSRNLADVAIDFDGDGITDLEAIWTWFGDVFPPLN